MSAIEDRLRETFAAHRADAPATDITWQAIRKDGRTRRKNRRALRYGGALAAAMLLVLAVVTVRVIRSDESAQDAPVLDSGPAAATMDASQRQLLQATVDLAHQIDLEGIYSSTWMSERAPNLVRHDPTPAVAAGATTVATHAQVDAQRAATDRARATFDAAAGPLTSAPSIPTGDLSLVTSIKASQSRLEGLAVNRVSTDNLQTDAMNTLDQYSNVADSLSDVMAAIGRTQPSATLAFDIDKVVAQQHIENDLTAQAAIVLMFMLTPEVPSPPAVDQPFQKLRTVSDDVERDRAGLQDLIDPTTPVPPLPSTPYYSTTSAVFAAAAKSNASTGPSVDLSPAQYLRAAIGEIDGLHQGAIRFLTQIGTTARAQYLSDGDATNAVRADVDVTHQLAVESILGGARLADPSLVSAGDLDQQRRRTDAAIDHWQSVVPPMGARVASLAPAKASERVATIAVVRRSIDQRQVAPMDAIEQYRLTSLAVLDTGKRAALAIRNAPLARTLIVATSMGTIEALRGAEASLYPAYAVADEPPPGLLWDRLKVASDDSARADKDYDDAASPDQKQIKRDTFKDDQFDDLKDRLFKAGHENRRASTTGVTASALLPLGLAQMDVLHAAALQVIDRAGTPTTSTRPTRPPSTAIETPVVPPSSPTVPSTPSPSNPNPSSTVTIITEPAPVRSSTTVPGETSTSSSTAVSSTTSTRG